MNASVLPHSLAMQLVQSVQTELERTQRGAAVAVVDAHGELLAFFRSEGCRLSCIDVAINKAYTAAREQRESKELGEASQREGFPLTNFGNLRYVSWGGGIPIRRNGEVVGAIGISGLPEADDIALGRFALAQLEHAL